VNWLARLLRKPPPLGAQQQSLLDAFRALPACNPRAPLAEQRCVVVDVESTGLDVFSDRLIAIGALDVVAGQLALGSGFEVVLRQAAPSAVDNILVHGIGGAEQTGGVDPADALLAFLQYLGNAPLIAHHADFDRTMIGRATREYLGVTLKNPWLDLALLAPALFPRHAGNRQTLDDWTARFGIENFNRHNALADACATAQLWLVLLSRLCSQGHTQLRDALQLQKEQQWLNKNIN